MKKLVLLILPIILLVACQRGTGILNPPTNIEYNESSMRITWNVIEDADSYVIQVNDQLYEQVENFFDMSDFTTGDYEVKIKTIYTKGESYYSNALVIRIIKEIDLEFSFQAFIFAWNKPIDNLNYKIKVYNQENILIRQIETDENETEVTEQGYARYEFEAYFFTHLVFETTIHFDMSGYIYARGIEDLNIYANIDGIATLDNQVLESSTDYELTDTVLRLSQATLENKLDGTYVFLIVGEEIYYTFITISSIQSPKLLSSPSVNYEGLDLVFDFELYGGSFLGLGSSPNIPSTMYTFDSGQLTINHAFIDQIMLNQPDRKTIIFSYVLENGPFTIIGYLTVNLK